MGYIEELGPLDFVYTQNSVDGNSTLCLFHLLILKIKKKFIIKYFFYYYYYAIGANK